MIFAPLATILLVLVLALDGDVSIAYVTAPVPEPPLLDKATRTVQAPLLFRLVAVSFFWDCLVKLNSTSLPQVKEVLP